MQDISVLNNYSYKDKSFAMSALDFCSYPVRNGLGGRNIDLINRIEFEGAGCIERILSLVLSILIVPVGLVSAGALLIKKISFSPQNMKIAEAENRSFLPVAPVSSNPKEESRSLTNTKYHEKLQKDRTTISTLIRREDASLELVAETLRGMTHFPDQVHMLDVSILKLLEAEFQKSNFKISGDYIITFLKTQLDSTRYPDYCIYLLSNSLRPLDDDDILMAAIKMDLSQVLLESLDENGKQQVKTAIAERRSKLLEHRVRGTRELSTYRNIELDDFKDIAKQLSLWKKTLSIRVSKPLAELKAEGKWQELSRACLDIAEQFKSIEWDAEDIPFVVGICRAFTHLSVVVKEFENGKKAEDVAKVYSGLLDTDSKFSDGFMGYFERYKTLESSISYSSERDNDKTIHKIIWNDERNPINKAKLIAVFKMKRLDALFTSTQALKNRFFDQKINPHVNASLNSQKRNQEVIAGRELLGFTDKDQLSEDEIQKKWKEFALKNHPDKTPKNPGEKDDDLGFMERKKGATQKFQEVAAARDFLIDYLKK